MAWIVEIFDETVREELDALPLDMRAKFQKIVEMIWEFGLSKVGMPYVRHIQGKLWEMRMKGRDGISRALYVTAVGQRLVVVMVFIKKTQKTPPKEIQVALERAKGIEE